MLISIFIKNKRKTMKKIFLSLILSLPSLAFANDLMSFDAECFVVDGKNKTEQCTFITGNDGTHVLSALELKNAVYFTKTPLDCVGQIGCQALLGTDEKHLNKAEFYVRDGKTKKVVNEAKLDDWGCYKQSNGKVDICSRLP
jgi:hypothetical protein